jgi:hypothetical protein
MWFQKRRCFWARRFTFQAATPIHRNVSRLSNIKILVTLSDRKRGIWTQKFMTEDLGEEDIVGDVLGFESVATDGAVGASQVAGLPRQFEGAEGGGHVLGELGAGGGVDGLGGRKLLRSRRVSRAWTSFLGSARTGIG